MQIYISFSYISKSSFPLFLSVCLSFFIILYLVTLVYLNQSGIKCYEALSLLQFPKLVESSGPYSENERDEQLLVS